MSPQLTKYTRRALAITAYCRARHSMLPAELADKNPTLLREAIGEADGILAIIDALPPDDSIDHVIPSLSDIEAIDSPPPTPTYLVYCAVCGVENHVPLGGSFTCECGATYGEGSTL